MTQLEQGRRQPGEPRWGVLYAGRLFLCASEEDRRRFIANPEPIRRTGDLRGRVFVCEFVSTKNEVNCKYQSKGCRNSADELLSSNSPEFENRVRGSWRGSRRRVRALSLEARVKDGSRPRYDRSEELLRVHHPLAQEVRRGIDSLDVPISGIRAIRESDSTSGRHRSPRSRALLRSDHAKCRHPRVKKSSVFLAALP